ncbi:Spy/CpxP family protein refolding chaperone [Kaarinaea lacus]
MNTISKTVLVVLIGAVTAIGVTACGHRHHSPEQRAERMVDKISSKLDLNEEQQQKLRAVKEEFVTAMRQHHQEQQQLFDQLIADVQKPQLDKQLLVDMVEKRRQAFDDIAPKVIDKIVEFHASLNDEQKQKAAEHMQYFREHFKKRHGEG